MDGKDGVRSSFTEAFVIRIRAIGLALALTAAGCSGTAPSGGGTPPYTPPPQPPNQLKHIIVLVQENRSFNNLFMSYPGTTTATSGPCVPSNKFSPPCKSGQSVKMQEITLETTGAPPGRDIQHDHAAFELEYDGGKMDGFDLITLGTGGGAGAAGLYPYAYIQRKEVQPYWDLAAKYAIGDNMFSTATTDSFVAHQQIVAGTTAINSHESIVDIPTDKTGNNRFPWGCDAPKGTVTSLIQDTGKVLYYQGPFPCFTQYKSMANVLDAKGVSWKYYITFGDFSGVVWDAYAAIKQVRYGKDWSNISDPTTNIFSDIKKGSLPSVSWVIPTLADSDHPASGSNTGPSWVTSVVNAVGKSKYWKDTAIIVVWDDWGGYYDPVAPPQTNYTSLGMRVPVLMISPWVRSGYVSHTQYDFGSILKTIEETFGTGSLGTADASANSLLDAFDFSQHSARPFQSVRAPYPASYFLRPRHLPPAQTVIDSDDGILPE